MSKTDQKNQIDDHNKDQARFQFMHGKPSAKPIDHLGDAFRLRLNRCEYQLNKSI